MKPKPNFTQDKNQIYKSGKHKFSRSDASYKQIENESKNTILALTTTLQSRAKITPYQVIQTADLQFCLIKEFSRHTRRHNANVNNEYHVMRKLQGRSCGQMLPRYRFNCKTYFYDSIRNKAYTKPYSNLNTNIKTNLKGQLSID